MSSLLSIVTPAARAAARETSTRAVVASVLIPGRAHQRGFRFGAAETEQGINALDSSRPIVTVFGATGHLGRYVVAHLGQMGAQVVCPNRSDEMAARHLRVMGDVAQVLPVQFNPKDKDSIRQVLQHSNIVINLIGRDYETMHWGYDDVHVKLTEDIASIADAVGVEQFVQVSAVGADTHSASRWLQSKARAEQTVKKYIPENSTITRLTHLFGPEDVYFNTYGGWAKRLPKMPVFRNMNAKMQLLYVQDAALGIVKTALDLDTRGEIFEFGGPEVKTTRQVMDDLFRALGERPNHFGVPKFLAGPISRIIEKFPFPVVTPDHVKRYSQNIVADNKKYKGLNDLQVPLTSWDAVAPGIYRRYRTAYRMATMRSNHVVQHTGGHIAQ